jgi:hypothetical protein
MRLECCALRFDTPLDARDLDLLQGALRGFCFRTMLARSAPLQLLTLALSSQGGGGRPWPGWWVAASDADDINQDIDDSTLIFLPPT